VDKPVFLSPFYGYPAELIATWCAVSLRTARAYKAGTKRPSDQARKLFALHRDGRVLEDAWVGWIARAGVITDPEGNSTTVNQLRAYALVMQFAAELARADPRSNDEFRRLLRRA
jgi:hypothetical protein